MKTINKLIVGSIAFFGIFSYMKYRLNKKNEYEHKRVYIKLADIERKTEDVAEEKVREMIEEENKENERNYIELVKYVKEKAM